MANNVEHVYVIIYEKSYTQPNIIEYVNTDVGISR